MEASLSQYANAYLETTVTLGMLTEVIRLFPENAPAPTEVMLVLFTVNAPLTPGATRIISLPALFVRYLPSLDARSFAFCESTVNADALQLLNAYSPITSTSLPRVILLREVHSLKAAVGITAAFIDISLSEVQIGACLEKQAYDERIYAHRLS